MRKPNDKKRPNTKGSAETRNRQRNFKYVHVSKKILAIDVPIGGPDSLTMVKQFVVERKGRTYRKPKEASNAAV